jgi:serine protease Do
MTIAGLDGELAEVAARLRRSTVVVRARSGHGSGIVASADGVVVTNAHVAGRGAARVLLDDGREFRGDPIAADPRFDLAALRIDADGLVPAQFRESRSLRAGEVVVAVGNPLDLVGALTAGIVHTLDRRGRSVVADLRLAPGNSGGPLADARGAVVGVNSMVVDGLAIAVGSEVVRRFLAAPGSRPHLGITVRPVRLSIHAEVRTGMLVLEVEPSSACARAGVMTGDVLIGVDGRLFTAASDLNDEVDAMTAEARVRLDAVRAGTITGFDVLVARAGGSNIPNVAA